MPEKPSLPKIAYALPEDVKPLHYNILWSLDFESLTFQGEVFIGVLTQRRTSSVTLHSAELSIPSTDCVWIAPVPQDDRSDLLSPSQLAEILESGCYTRATRAQLNTNSNNDGNNNNDGRDSRLLLFPDLDKKQSPQTAPVLDEKEETVTLGFQSPLEEGGVYLLRVRFQGFLNNNMVGLYRTTYTNAAGEQKFSACTQFEPVDARRAFPCWDEPNRKASFDVTVGGPVHMTALGNMPAVMVKTILPKRRAAGRSGEEAKQQQDEKEDEEGKKTEEVEGVIEPSASLRWSPGQKVTKFDTLPTMSTYLVATVIGEYDYIGTRVDDRVELRIYTPIGKTETGRFALKVATSALQFYEEYFDMKYPFPKLDLIGIPDFGAGAMENTGLITYRESRLLLDPDQASRAAMEAAARTICHEIAHMWFGNSTTMDSWTYLYLNEAFARLTEFLGVDHVFPEWDIWTQFTESVHSRALSLDGLASTHAIEVDVKSPAEINEVFDIISYAKGASVLKMVRGWVGEDNFMRGIRTYLKRHAWKNTVSDDLWTALGEAAGMPDLVHSMENWIREPGYPVVSLELLDQKLSDASAAGVFRVRITQKHFLGSGGKFQPSPSDTVWTIPLTFAGPGVKTTDQDGVFRYILRERETVLDIPAQAGVPGSGFLANVGRDGFYRVLYKGGLWDGLLELLERAEDDCVRGHDLIGLVSDTVALMNANLLPVAEFLRFVKTVYAQEQPSTEAILKCGAALRGLSEIHAQHPKQKELLKLLRSLYEPIFQRFLKTDISGMDRLSQRLFCSSLTILAAADYQEAIDYILGALRRADEQPAWLRDTLYPLGVKYGGRTEYELLRTRIANPDNDAEERKRLLMSVGATRDPELLRQTLRWSLTEDRSDPTAVRVGEILYVFAGFAANDTGAHLVWKHISEDWESFYTYVGKTGPLFGHCVAYALSGFSEEQDAEAVEDFFRRNPVEEIVRVVRQSLERIRERVFRKETQGPQLDACVFV